MDHALTRREPIEAFVPLNDEPRRKGGRKKGTPNRPKMLLADNTAEPAPEVDAPPTCPTCSQRVVIMSLDLARELTRASRDKILESEGEVMSALALADTLYLAARFDGYCSLSCWRKKRAEG